MSFSMCWKSLEVFSKALEKQIIWGKNHEYERKKKKKNGIGEAQNLGDMRNKKAKCLKTPKSEREYWKNFQETKACGESDPEERSG